MRLITNFSEEVDPININIRYIYLYIFLYFSPTKKAIHLSPKKDKLNNVDMANVSVQNSNI